MLLTVDIGNTNIVFGIFEGDCLIKELRVATDIKRTSDEYTAVVKMLLNDCGISGNMFTKSILSSVVPDLIGPFISLITNLTGRKPILIEPSMYDRLPLTIPESAVHEIGTDLLANAVQAWTICHCANIVVDFGTALSFIATDADANIQGVAIAPGIKTAVHSLFSNTAQVPEVPLVAPENALGQNTIHSVQAGIVLGYKGLVESLVDRMKTDLSERTGVKKEQVKVIATGGLNNVLKPITDIFSVVDKQLTVCGLKTIAGLF